MEQPSSQAFGTAFELRFFVNLNKMSDGFLRNVSNLIDETQNKG